MKDMKTRGIIIRKTNYSESDVIFDVLSEHGEVVGFFARGARKMKSRFSGVVQPGLIVKITYRTGKNLNYPSEIMIDPQHIFSFYTKSLRLMNFFTDVLSMVKFISKDLSEKDLFTHLIETFTLLEQQDADPITVYNEFLDFILSLMGVNTELYDYFTGDVVYEKEFFYIPAANRVISAQNKPQSLDAEWITYDNVFRKNYLQKLVQEHINSRLKFKF